MQELEQDNLSELIANNDTVVVQYGATWCGNCRMVKPKFKKLAEETQGVQFVYVDAEKFPQSRKLAQVNNLPTFALFKGGEFLKQAQGNKIDVVKELLK
jgi:thiol-disulfide isomerase/thioredoxin